MISTPLRPPSNHFRAAGSSMARSIWRSICIAPVSRPPTSSRSRSASTAPTCCPIIMSQKMPSTRNSTCPTRSRPCVVRGKVGSPISPTKPSRRRMCWPCAPHRRQRGPRFHRQVPEDYSVELKVTLPTAASGASCSDCPERGSRGPAISGQAGRSCRRAEEKAAGCSTNADLPTRCPALTCPEPCRRPVAARLTGLSAGRPRRGKAAPPHRWR